MITAELLKDLCCPETHQDLTIADAATVETLNQRIAAGTVKNKAGKNVSGKIDGGLIRSDRKALYPIRGGIPVLLVDEAIAL
ncbi:MAG TPA: hypothetical protein VK968_13840 [Roseimicrobium sp.]|nr:hypothetical protein [Roseimicrobium sp.]